MGHTFTRGQGVAAAIDCKSRVMSAEVAFQMGLYRTGDVTFCKQRIGCCRVHQFKTAVKRHQGLPRGLKRFQLGCRNEGGVHSKTP